MLPPSSRATRLAAASAALGCGIVAMAAGGLPASLDAGLALAVALAWQVWREALGETHWAPLVNRWRSWTTGEPLPRLPYTEPGTRSEALSRAGGQFRDFVRRRVWPERGPTVAAAIAAFIVSALLSWALSPLALTLTAAALLIPQGALLFRGTRIGRLAAAADAGLIEVGLPFALGATLIGLPGATAIGLAGATTLAWAGLRAGPDPVAWQAGNAAALGLLAAGRHSVGAFLFALCWLPQLIGSLGGVSRRAGPWLMAGLLAASLAIQ